MAEAFRRLPGLSYTVSWATAKEMAMCNELLNELLKTHGHLPALFTNALEVAGYSAVIPITI